MYSMKTNLRLAEKSEQIPTRILARSIVQDYKKRMAEAPPETPPLKSIRSVYYAASTGRKRSFWRRIRSRLVGDILDQF